MSRGEGKKAVRKNNYWNRLGSLLEEYSRILIVSADNVGSSQMQQIRKALRGKNAVLLMGKNTMTRTAIRDHLPKAPLLEGILPHLKGNVGMVFTNGDLADIRARLTELKIRAAAKAGSIAPIEVIVPAGSTYLEPTKTSFFQALSIPSKINRGSIEIINDIHLLTVGQKVSLSQAALLQMLGIKPFQYGLKVTTVYDNGTVHPDTMGELTDTDLLERVFRGISNIAALSLQIGYPTVVSVPHSVSGAYTNLLAISEATDYTFPGSEKIKQLLSDPAPFTTAQQDVDEEEEEEEYADMGIFWDEEEEEEEYPKKAPL